MKVPGSRFQVPGLAISTVLILWSMIYGLPNSHADVFSSTDLINEAAKWDGEKIVYAGEAVSAVMDRGTYSWVNLNDGNNAIGIWTVTRLLKYIKHTGDYRNKGDIVEVVGTFHRACKMHGGDMDIHAYSVKILKRGYRVHENIDTARIRYSAAILALLIVSVVIFRKRT